MKLVAEGSKSLEYFSIYAKIFKLHKAYLLLISDNEEMGLGTIILGIPSLIKDLKPNISSYQLFGLDDNIFYKIIAERAVNKFKVPVLTIILLKTKFNEKKILKSLINFIDELFEKAKKKD
ncbi:MAG: hypothetical protein ACTSQP_08420 [Promethearchaeota archaeon]